MRNVFHVLTVVLCFLLTACGEDRTHEYEELTQHNHWIYDVMCDKYLWADNITDEPAWKKFFGDADTFLGVVTAYGDDDDWSYVLCDTVESDPHSRGYYNHGECYGFDFVLMTDPTGQTSKQYVRVKTVYPGSPAEECGLSRGDFISFYDGYKLSSSNISNLCSGQGCVLTVCHLGYDLSEQAFVWEDTVSLVMGAARHVDDLAFPVTDVKDTLGMKVAYMMCNHLSPDKLTSGDNVYMSQLDEIMGGFREAGISELILDMRLCNDGTLDMARRLASYVVDQTCRDGVFAKTMWNSYNSDLDSVYYYDSSVGSLGLGRVYVIVSGYTQGAAEWFINSLRKSQGEENVILVGQTTAGQNVMTDSFRSDVYGLTLCPAVAYVADADGEYDYSAGFTPSDDNAVNEYDYVQLYPYGDARETLLSRAFYLIAH